MDLSFARFERFRRSTAAGIPDLDILLAGLSTRQSTSPTARAQSALGGAVRAQIAISPMVALFALGIHRVSGSFSPAVASLLTPRKPT